VVGIGWEGDGPVGVHSGWELVAAIKVGTDRSSVDVGCCAVTIGFFKVTRTSGGYEGVEITGAGRKRLPKGSPIRTGWVFYSAAEQDLDSLPL